MDVPVPNTPTVSHAIVPLLVIGIILAIVTFVVAAIFRANGQAANVVPSPPVYFP